MNPVDWTRVSEIFGDALELPPDQRGGFVAARCSGRPDELEAVMRLLAADQAADPGFPGSLDPSALEAAALILDDAPKQIGPWRLAREIGEGGMGQVFLAERSDGQFDQRVAIKVLKRGMDSHAILARFLRERRILAGLDHPNIARLLDGGIAEDGRPYFVMEHVDGQTIIRYADDHRLSIDDRLTLFQQVCLALEYAHRNLVVHRDLKPSNIVVTSDGRPKLLDFGIAKLLTATTGEKGADTLTEAGARPMTPEYAAPEQFTGGPISTSTDVYGLGVVLHELLSGRRPRTRADSGTGRAASWTGEPDSLSTAASGSAETAAARGSDPERLCRQLAGDLENIVAMALRAEPARRYQSVAELREDIVRHQRQLPVRARADTARYRVSRFIRRHRPGVAATALIAALLVAFGVNARMQADALRVERDRAQQEADAAQQVSDFLVGVFEVSDPMKTGLGDSVRARDLLDQGMERVKLALAGQPAIEARMLGVIGRAYANLGRHGEAEEALLGAVRLLQIDFTSLGDGEPPEDVVQLLARLASVQTARGDYAAAISTLDQAIAAQERRAPRSAALLGLLAQQADVVHAAGDMDGARRLVGRALLRFETIPADSLQADAASLRQLSEALAYSRDWDRADSVFARLLELEMRKGIGGADAASVWANWAGSLLRRGNLPGADSLLEKALGIHLATDSTASAAAQVMVSLGTVASMRRQHRRAEALLRRGIAAFAGRLGENHPFVAAAKVRLARMLEMEGRAAEAIPIYRSVIAFHHERDESPSYVPVVRYRLATALRQAGRPEEAERVFMVALREHVRWFPAEYPITARLRLDYARLLLEQERLAEAAPLLQRAIPVLARSYGEQDSTVQEARQLLATTRRASR